MLKRSGLRGCLNDALGSGLVQFCANHFGFAVGLSIDFTAQ